MKKRHFPKRALPLGIVLLLVFSLLLPSAAGAENTAAVQADGEPLWQAYNGRRLGIMVGPLMEDAAAEYFPDSEILLLDEPTSALDPTMVDEVQSVIRELARSGKTMMIVTHEMNFARAISNRVFYMDEGGICEEGTPEQIFDHPQKEQTRRFIKKLKVLELLIDSRDFDFLGASTQLDRYCLQNSIPPREKYRIRLALEELLQQILLPRLSALRIRVCLEYSAREETTDLTVSYAGEAFDPRETDNTLSLAVLKSTAEEIRYSFHPEAEEQNCVQLRLK